MGRTGYFEPPNQVGCEQRASTQQWWVPLGSGIQGVQAACRQRRQLKPGSREHVQAPAHPGSGTAQGYTPTRLEVERAKMFRDHVSEVGLDPCLWELFSPKWKLYCYPKLTMPRFRTLRRNPSFQVLHGFLIARLHDIRAPDAVDQI